MVAEGETGLLVPPSDAQALAAAVAALLRDPQRRQALGRAGQARARGAFFAAAIFGYVGVCLRRITGAEARCGLIAVTGATGYMGSFLLPRLVARDEAVRCLVRPGTDAAALVRIGAEIARGDLEEPAAVAAALRDARVVLHLAHIRYAPAVLAGVGAGVERLVLVSSLRRFSRVADASVAAVTAGGRRVGVGAAVGADASVDDLRTG